MNPGETSTRRTHETLCSIAGCAWRCVTLVALAVGGFVGSFLIAVLPILGLFVLVALLVGVALGKSREVVLQALAPRLGRAPGRSVRAVP